MPQHIEQVFSQAKVSLLPEKRGDLKTHCSCPDEANPCKHIAAVYYLLGEEFDRDPFLIFRLRGLDREALLARLGAKAGHDEPEPAAVVKGEPLPTEPSGFWTPRPLPDDFFGEVQGPPVSAGLVRRLGKFPFWRGEDPLVEGVEPTYLAASAKGLAVFLGESAQASASAAPKR
ncbi:MAG: SWIM zinc finger family protein [Gemmataceae bacterium]